MPSTDRQNMFDITPVCWPAFQPLVQFQQEQWQSLLLWQQSLLAIQQDLYDQWLSRCAGGARLDD